MRFREAVREAWRNIVSGTTRTLQWCLLFTVVVAALAWIDVDSIKTTTNSAVDYVKGGGATWALQGPAVISGQACEALSKTTGIVASGAVRADTNKITTRALPAAPVPVYDVTPGFLGILGLNDAQSEHIGVDVSNTVAERYGLHVGSQWGTSTGRLNVSGIYQYPDDGRLPTLQFAAVAPVMTAGSTPFDECWITVWPSNQDMNQLLYTALTQDGAKMASDPQMQQSIKLVHVNSSFASTFDGYGTFNTRMTRWFSLGAVLAGLVIGFASMWIRRLEFASGLHAGVPKRLIAVEGLLETLSWVIPGLLFATVAILFSVRGAEADTSQIALLGLRSLIAGGAGALIGSVVAVLFVREKHLFRLFKQR
jgi:hypothetical protein